MNSSDLDHFIAKAQRENLLPVDAVVVFKEHRPWPIILLSALGAWLAAIPLIVLLGYVFLRELHSNGTTAAGIGLMVTVLACALLRSKSLTIFVEQLGFPCLVAGMFFIGFALTEVFHSDQITAMTLLGVCMVVAYFLPQYWLRVLLGAAAAACALVGLASAGQWRVDSAPAISLWTAYHLLIIFGLVALSAPRVRALSSHLIPYRVLLDALSSGWITACVIGFTCLPKGLFDMRSAVSADASSVDGLDPSFLGLFGIEIDYHVTPVLLTICACVVLVIQWPSVRRLWCICLMACSVVLAWFIPAIAPLLLIVACTAGNHRWVMTSLASLCIAWLIGTFYYSLSLRLVDKAMLMGAIAIALAGLALLGSKQAGLINLLVASDADSKSAPSTSHWRSPALGILVAVLLTLGVVNVGVWQKEQLIRSGKVVFMPLVPVDPRSLMQGDYMALNFLQRIPQVTQPNADSDPEGQTINFSHSRMIFQLTTQGIASLVGVDDGRPLKADEIVIQLTRKADRWILVTDAFYFKEGEADRWSKAKFAEFRVDGRGKALLIGLRGAELKPL